MIKLSTETESKYVDIRKRSKMPYQFYIGARGTGKTFSALRPEVNAAETGVKFAYLRNRSIECEVASTQVGNAFKSINRAYNTDIVGHFDKSKGVGYWYDDTNCEYDENGKKIGHGALIGYSFALSTIGGARSIDLTDLDHIIFEEFIPEEYITIRKGRGKAFANFMETANRNREFEGKPPITVYFLANAITLTDEILREYNIVRDITSMIKAHELRRTIPERGIYIELVTEEQAEIVRDKRGGAVYRAFGEEFANDALGANFVKDQIDLAGRLFDRHQYRLLMSYDNFSIYRKNGERLFYIAANGEKARQHFLKTDALNFRRQFRPIYNANIGRNAIYFDSYTTKNDIEEALML